MKLLIVEDQPQLIKNIATFGKLEGYTVAQATTSDEALAEVETDVFDAILLDLNLPGKDGMELAKLWRKNGVKTPILILTARTAKNAVIAGLDVGADDYITKPFDMDELFARIRSSIRRSSNEPSPVIRVGSNIEIRTNTKEVFLHGKPVKLAPKEYSLFEFLALNKNKIQERATIIEHVWGEYDELMFSQTVDVHIAYLRKKLGRDVISTGSGGYLIKEEIAVEETPRSNLRESPGV
jgi:two-component system, OmpR family, response regulator